MNADDRDLLHRHLNGDLDASEQAAFFARLQSSPELRRELASLAFDETLVSELLLEKKKVAAPSKRRSWLPAAAVAAVMLIVLAGILSLGRVRELTLRVASLDGSAALLREGREEPLTQGQDLRLGDRVATSRGGAVLERKGLRLELGPESAFLLTKAKGMELVSVEKGVVLARVASDRYHHLTAPGGFLYLKDATVRIEAGPRRTLFEVEQGSVELESGPVNRIVAGQYISFTPTASAPEIGRLVARVKVDAAVRRACAFLAQHRNEIVAPMISEKRNAPPPRRTYAELALLALHRGGIPDADPFKAELLGLVTGRSIESTYIAAIQAMTLAEIDPVAHHERLRLCAQLLIDSQCANGQWDYAVKLAVPGVPATGRLRRRGEGPASGDNSVAAYAVLGLHAAARAGIDVDPEILERARAWWLKCQNADGGWGYNEAGVLTPLASEQPMYTGNTSYGSATASAVAALAAIRDLREGDAEAAIHRGVAWLGANFAADRTPKKAPGFLPLHWLSMAGRAGRLLATERFGDREWYAEGAEFLLRTQKPGGEWAAEQGEFMAHEKMDVLDTCLAILFLKRDGR